MNKAGMLVEKIYHDAVFADRIAPDMFPTGVSYTQGKFLSRAVSRYTPQVVIELGFRYGISSLWIQSAAHPPRRHIIVDPYHHIPSPPKQSTIDDFIKKQKGVTLEDSMTSQEYLARVMQSGTKVDFVFVDASQWFDSVMTDMFFVSRVLRIHGVVIIRNLWNRPVRKAVMFYLKNLPYSLEGAAPWKEWVIKHVPVIGELFLRISVRSLGLCVLRVTGPDERISKHIWNHFIPF